ncbi:hypothetical protein HMPREF9439_02382 [Parasutterella excrementihominis YIT 11859]|uniref:Uncharacterized protein n=1 Tax=Parasutterella excrementihominis YIT 11859 TaxID=762966 RepID=F3QN52_9BURK|nr:hypothetical protein HMPREF9439_02382 [Parasutterella excrementihominis YIT 11859]
MNFHRISTLPVLLIRLPFDCMPNIFHQRMRLTAKKQPRTPQSASSKQ